MSTAEEWSVSVHDLFCSTTVGTEQHYSLRDVNFTAPAGKLTVLLGKAGSGNTQIIEVLSGLKAADRGTVLIAGHDMTVMSESELTNLRRSGIDTLFPEENLFDSLTVEQNLVLPALLSGHEIPQEKFDAVVDTFRIRDVLDDLPKDVSLANQQRAALARAALDDAKLLLCDDPVAKLPSTESGEILALLRMCVREYGMTAILAGFDITAASLADFLVIVDDGATVGRMESPTLQAIMLAIERLGSRRIP